MQNAHKIKQDICEIGRRIYTKGFAAANDGNITVRIGENEVLCTPTMHCKGFLKPEDISTIDMTGKQIAGAKKRSSEALLHLEIYKQRPDVKSSCIAIRRTPPPSRSPTSRFRSACCRRSRCFSATCRSPNTKRPADRPSPTRSCRSSRRPTSSSWPITARSVTAKTSSGPTGGPRFSTPTAAC